MNIKLLLRKYKTQSDGAQGRIKLTNYEQVEILPLEFRPISAKDGFLMMRHQRRVTHVLKIRYTDKINPDSFFYKPDDNRTFNVSDYFDPDETKRFLTVSVEEIS